MELSSLGSLLESSDDGRRVLKHFEGCKSTVRKNYYVCTQGCASLVISTCMSHCLCSCRDSRWCNNIRAEGGLSIIGHFFNFLVTGLFISFDKSKSVLCFPCDVIYVGSSV